jgi:cis-3-alkyl-4-acyloxetan-2-one decarboxylase
MSHSELPAGEVQAQTPRPAAPKISGGKSRQRDAERARLDPEYQFTPHFVNWNGTWLHFVDEGDPNAPAVLCVHGNPTWSFLWRKQIQSLRQTHRVIAIDLPGMGLSQRLPGRTWRLAEHVEALEFLVAELGITKLTLLLHDWGGPIGLGFARRHPESLAGIVLTNTAGFPFKHMPSSIALARHPVLGGPLVQGLGLFNRGALRTGFRRRQPLSPVERCGYLEPYAKAKDRAQVLAFVRDIPDRPDHPSYAELEATGQALEGLRSVPRLVIWGQQDPVFHGPILAEWRRRWPDAEYVEIAAAGHFVMEDDPEQVNSRLQGFLNNKARY